MIARQSNRMISGGGFNSRRLDGGWEKTKINRSILGRFRDNRGGESVSYTHLTLPTTPYV